MSNRKATQQKAAPLVITATHDKILKQAIYPYHLLTAQQITRRLYPTPKLGMLTTVQTRLTHLTKAKYLRAYHLPTPEGQRPYIYHLGLGGRRYLQNEELDMSVYYLPSDHEETSFNWQMHVLELNDFLISAAILEKDVPHIHLFDWQHDLLLKRTPFDLLTTTSKKHQAVPDALLDFRLSREGKKDLRYFFWVEYDRDNHSNEKFRRKLRDILICHEQGLLEKRYGVQRFTALFVTSAGTRRVEKMKMLARLEFGSVAENSHTNQMFKFTSVSPLMQQQPTARSIFCEPFWTTAYGDPEQHLALINPSV
jgi:Replication-relaxation